MEIWKMAEDILWEKYFVLVQGLLQLWPVLKGASLTNVIILRLCATH